MATELEIMIHAKGYLDKLANGVNPLTNESLPETDIVNQVRISRCLFYVSDVLRQVIEHGGITKPKRTPKIPFHLTDAQLQNYQFFPEPIHVSAIIERINSLIDQEYMQRLSHRSITTFLEREGFLAPYVDSQGKNKREPTEKGLHKGISTEIRTGQYGSYQVILYDQSMQHFILDHMNQIAEIQMPSKPGSETASYQKYEAIDPETGEILSGIETNDATGSVQHETRISFR